MTTDWTEGYVADHTYEHYYFPALAPNYIRACLLLSGLDLPLRKPGEPMRYLELGYGQGFSLNLHAATDQEAEFWGTDFLPEQTLSAREIALRAGLGTHLLNDSFAEFDEKAKAGMLPLFDIIVLHGIWSWINRENHEHILNIIRTSLKPGGAVYISYNSMPGRVSSMPLRELMTIHSDRKGAGKDSVTRATEAAALIYALVEGESTYFSYSPASRTLVEHMKTQSPVYLAHEYLNRNWHASYFFEIAKNMASAGCRFVTAANILESALIAQPEKTRSFLNAVSDPVSWEALKDFNQNTGFRRDIFVKDPVSLAPDEWRERLDSSYWSLGAPLTQTDSLSAVLPFATFNLDKSVYDPLLEVLAEDSLAPKSLAFLRTHPRLVHFEYDDFISCIRMLFGCSFIYPAQPSSSAKTLSACRSLNSILCDLTAKGNLQDTLASPVLARGFGVSEHFQLFLRSYMAGIKDPVKWTEDAFSIMSAQGKTLRTKTSQDDQEGLVVFLQEARRFEKDILPFMKTIGIAPDQ